MLKPLEIEMLNYLLFLNKLPCTPSRMEEMRYYLIIGYEPSGISRSRLRYP